MLPIPSLSRNRFVKRADALERRGREIGSSGSVPEPTAAEAAPVPAVPEEPRKRTYVARIRVRDLKVPSYQTKVHPQRVKHLVATWDDDARGIPEVSWRDGVYWLVDGQHRQATLMELGRGDDDIECVLHIGLTLPEEAALYTKLADRRQKAAANVHRARALAGSVVEMETERLLGERGLSSGPETGWAPGRVSAVGIVNELLARHGPGHVGAVLDICQAVWGEQHGAYNKFTIRGVSQFVRAYPEAPHGRIVERLSAHGVTPKAFENEARRIRMDERRDQSEGYSAGRAVLHFVNLRAQKRLKNVFVEFAAEEEAERRRLRAAERSVG